MNFGGFSWRRLVGISAFKSRISRKIGIPLTASGRRRKLGASVFNAVGSIAGTAVAAATAVKQEKLNRATLPPLPNFSSLKGVYFCEVKGVTHNNDDGTSRIAAQQLCSVGDTVRLVPEPSNIHDRNAIRVLLQTGEQIGYISARQAARFKGRVHLLTATVHSRIKDRWGNDTVKLRVSVEQKVYEAATVPSVTAIQAEATETREKEGWQGVLVYFENAGQRLYKVVKAEDAETISRSLQEGMVRVGFIGLTDTPTGIQFTFTLNDSFPTDGIVAKRFLANAREWVVTESKGICARRGDPPPVVGTFQPSEQSTHSPAAMTKPEGWGAGTILLTLLAMMVVGGSHCSRSCGRMDNNCSVCVFADPLRPRAHEHCVVTHVARERESTHTHNAEVLHTFNV
jgi:hypothetical protein